MMSLHILAEVPGGHCARAGEVLSNASVTRAAALATTRIIMACLHSGKQFPESETPDSQSPLPQQIFLPAFAKRFVHREGAGNYSES